MVNRLVLFLAAGASAIALTGCAPSGDVAVKVGDVTYSDNDVALLTGFECEYGKDPSSGTPPVSRAAVRSFMATILVGAAVDKKILDDAKVHPGAADVAADLKTLDPAIDKVAQGEDRDRLRSILESVLIGNVGTQFILQQTLGQQLGQMSQEQAQQVIREGIQKLRTNAVGKLDIQTEPSLALTADGLTPATTDTSLSLAESSFAKTAGGKDFEQSWLSTLPAGQRCN